MSKKAIAYILAEFPSQTETFILKEALYVNESIPLYIIALKKGKSSIDSHIYAKLGNRIVYIPQWWSWKLLQGGILNMKVLYRKYVFAGFRNNLRQIKILLTALLVSEEIEKLQIKHIHAHFANYPTDVAMMVSKFSGIPFSFSAHANDIYVNPQKLTQKISESKFVTTCTQYNKKWMDNLVIPFERNKIHLLYHGVDLERWQYNSFKNQQERKQILFIGRLIEKKGVIYLLKAIELLKKKRHLIHLIIVGKGKDEKMLKKFCCSHELSKDVTFLGWQDPQRIKDLFACSDMFVLPSVIASDGDRDGIPNVILEAMASGLPIITTPVSGITEVIQHGYSGLLVPERNVNQLADSILALINDETLRNLLCNNALHTMSEKFDSKKCNILLKNLFDSKSSN